MGSVTGGFVAQTCLKLDASLNDCIGSSLLEIMYKNRGVVDARGYWTCNLYLLSSSSTIALVVEGCRNAGRSG